MCSLALGRIQTMYINMIKNVENRMTNCKVVKIKSQVVVDFKSKASLWYSLFSLFKIPHSFFFLFFYIVIGTNLKQYRPIPILR